MQMLNEYKILYDEYNEELNKELKDLVKAHSHKKYWWTCKLGHTWEQSPHNRIRINKETKESRIISCPYCNDKATWPGFNDLKTRFPKIAEEFNEEKNKCLSSEIRWRQPIIVWWKCNKGHEWQANIRDRTKENGTNCPYCTNRKIKIGENDFKTCFPNLASSWDYVKNKTKPENYLPHSPKKVWWICENCGKSHFISIDSKSGHGDKKALCELCAQKLQESKIATELKDYCIKKYSGTKEEYRILKNEETNMWLPYDIYITEYNLFIEVQGQQHYEYRNKFYKNYEQFKYRQKIDKKKKEFALKNGNFLEIDLRKIKNTIQAINILEDFINTLND